MIIISANSPKFYVLFFHNYRHIILPIFSMYSHILPIFFPALSSRGKGVRPVLDRIEEFAKAKEAN
jgi:hypothetical protein